jgi:hypothetical protein
MMKKYYLIGLLLILILFTLPAVSADNVTINSTNSIADTINNANNNTVIYLNPGTYNQSGININKNISIQGNGNPKDIIINGNNESSIFFINNQTVYINNITFINGYNNEFGGAINSESSNVYVNNCIFINNTAKTINGGAINNAGTLNTTGYLFVNNSYFKGNYAGHDGGAITTYRGSSDIYNSIFTENYAYRDGGAVRGGIYSKTFIQYCLFENNTAREWGGALYNWPGKLTVLNSTINNNTAGTKGGAIITSGPLNVFGCIITNNKAGTYGGAIYIDEETPGIPSTATVHNNIIMNNTGGMGAQDIYIELTTSKKTNFDDNYWGTNNPLNGTDYPFNWNQRVEFNNFTKNPVKWITENINPITPFNPSINSSTEHNKNITNNTESVNKSSPMIKYTNNTDSSKTGKTNHNSINLNSNTNTYTIQTSKTENMPTSQSENKILKEVILEPKNQYMKYVFIAIIIGLLIIYGYYKRKK